jgi:hypothetical protein
VRRGRSKKAYQPPQALLQIARALTMCVCRRSSLTKEKGDDGQRSFRVAPNCSSWPTLVSHIHLWGTGALGQIDVPSLKAKLEK